MNTAIVYVSQHHGNTKKLADAIAKKYSVVLIDASDTQDADLSKYDLIGFASGVAYGKLYKQMSSFMEKNLPAEKCVFFLYTCGRNDKDFCTPLKAFTEQKGCKIAGSYGCLGFDTFGPFKLIGGINKGHPDENEIKGAVEFFEGLQKA